MNSRYREGGTWESRSFSRGTPDVEARRPARRRGGASALAVGLSLAFVATAAAQDVRPYDDRMLRLSELLGAVHYLRELCEADDGQHWRERMRELLDADATTALRRARFTRNFNNGYRSFSRTYTSCTPTAKTALARFLAEGAQIADTLVRTIP